MNRKILLIILIVVFSASMVFCENNQEQKNVFANASQAIEGKTFCSLEKGEIGLGPEGVVYDYWTISFNKGILKWHYSDIKEAGHYECNG